MRRVLSLPTAVGFAAITLFVCPLGVTAQSVSVGLTAGGADSRQVLRGGWGGDWSTDTRSGRILGVVATLPAGRFLAIRMEGSYAEKGWGTPGGPWMHLEYVELPILARIGTPIDHIPVGVFLVSGVAPAIEVSCAAKLLPAGYSVSYPGLFPPPPPEPADCVRLRSYRGDLGIVLGAGLAFTARGLTGELALRRTRGLVDIDPERDRGALHNRTTAVTLAVSLPVRSRPN